MAYEILPQQSDGELPDLSGILQQGDRVVWGHACGEPATLVEALLSQAGAIGGISAFAGSSFSQLLRHDAAREGLPIRPRARRDLGGGPDLV